MSTPDDGRPPFTRETAIEKIKKVEDAWNSRDPERVSLAYTADSLWRNRSEFLQGRVAIVAFLQREWVLESENRLIKELLSFSEDRIAVRFAYEWHDLTGTWFRSYGNENWAFDAQGLMRERHASINDVAIGALDRKFNRVKRRTPRGAPGLERIGMLIDKDRAALAGTLPFRVRPEEDRQTDFAIGGASIWI